MKDTNIDWFKIFGFLLITGLSIYALVLDKRGQLPSQNVSEKIIEKELRLQDNIITNHTTKTVFLKADLIPLQSKLDSLESLLSNLKKVSDTANIIRVQDTTIVLLKDKILIKDSIILNQDTIIEAYKNKTNTYEVLLDFKNNQLIEKDNNFKKLRKRQMWTSVGSFLAGSGVGVILGTTIKK